MDRPAVISLHVGAHKTASTHLQKTLRGHGELLSAHGVRYVGPERLRRPGRSLKNRFAMDREPGPAEKAEARRKLARMAGGARRLVISEENLLGRQFAPGLPVYPEGDLRLNKMVRLCEGIPVNVFLAVRDPADWLGSLYRHALFNGRHVPFDIFAEGTRPEDISWRNLAARLVRVPGVAQLIVWPMEAYPGNAGQLFRRMTRWKAGPRITPIASAVNVGLSAQAVQEVLAGSGSLPPLELARAALKRHPVAGPGDLFDPWAPEQRAAGRAAYLEDLAAIAEMPGCSVIGAPGAAAETAGAQGGP